MSGGERVTVDRADLLAVIELAPEGRFAQRPITDRLIAALDSTPEPPDPQRWYELVREGKAAAERIRSKAEAWADGYKYGWGCARAGAAPATTPEPQPTPVATYDNECTCWRCADAD